MFGHHIQGTSHTGVSTVESVLVAVTYCTCIFGYIQDISPTSVSTVVTASGPIPFCMTTLSGSTQETSHTNTGASTAVADVGALSTGLACIGTFRYMSGKSRMSARSKMLARKKMLARRRMLAGRRIGRSRRRCRMLARKSRMLAGRNRVLARRRNRMLAKRMLEHPRAEQSVSNAATSYKSISLWKQAIRV